MEVLIAVGSLVTEPETPAAVEVAKTDEPVIVAAAVAISITPQIKKPIRPLHNDMIDGTQSRFSGRALGERRKSAHDSAELASLGEYPSGFVRSILRPLPPRLDTCYTEIGQVTAFGINCACYR